MRERELSEANQRIEALQQTLSVSQRELKTAGEDLKNKVRRLRLMSGGISPPYASNRSLQTSTCLARSICVSAWRRPVILLLFLFGEPA